MKSKEISEIKKMIRETAQDAVKEAIREKTEILRENKPVQEIAGAVCGMSSESVRLIFKFIQCFGVFITLIYAVRQLIKEISSPL